jgi:hypothetical protein
MAKSKHTPTPTPSDEVATLADLKPDPQNRRKRTPRNTAMIAESFRTVGAARSIVIDEGDQVLAGNGALDGATAAGITKLHIVEVEGDTLVAVRRRGLSDEQKRALALYDNRSAELAEWNDEQLKADLDNDLSLQPFWTAEEEEALASNSAAEDVLAMAASTDGEEPAAPKTAGHPTFSCPVTIAQERSIRAALRIARAVFDVTSTGDALAAALDEWATSRTPNTEERHETTEH